MLTLALSTLAVIGLGWLTWAALDLADQLVRLALRCRPPPPCSGRLPHATPWRADRFGPDKNRGPDGAGRGL